MKKILLFISCLLVIPILTIPLVSALNINNTDIKLSKFQNKSYEIEPSVLKKQYLASEDNEKILEYFQNQTNKDDYPDYYGGTYINHENELVVMITENTNTIQKTLKDVTENPTLKFENVKYSYRELNNIIDEIGIGITQNLQNKNSNKDNIYNYITGTVLLDDKNKIEVFIKDINESKIADFKSLFEDSDMFIFKKDIETIEDASI